VSEKIQPALTPEEWKRGGVRRGDWEEGPGTDDEGRAALWCEGGSACWPFDLDDAHQMAALCLRGQPFGFTWEDVDDERAELAAIEESLSEWRARSEVEDISKYFDATFADPLGELGRRVARKRVRIAKIEALLPPREP
jgi:hypothetical protein